MIVPLDVEAIERATLKALPPLLLVEDDGWFLAANEGAIGRANSVLPLSAGRDRLEQKLDRALAFYAKAGLSAAFRISERSAPVGLPDALSARGFAPEQLTDVLIADLDAVVDALAGVVLAELRAVADDPWRAVFLGSGFDPVEGTKRAATLARAMGAVYAGVRDEAATVAIGAACVDGAWAGLHGMRTVLSHRRRGLAFRVLAALTAEACERGARRLFLQVERENAPAQALYARLGFVRAYDYTYWRAM